MGEDVLEPAGRQEATKVKLKAALQVAAKATVRILDFIEAEREKAQRHEILPFFSDKELDWPGVYIYTYPGYENRAYKIGMSSRSVIERVKEQSRGTAIPEEALIVRAIRTHDCRQLEKDLHKHLAAARTAGGGQEWFRIALKELDQALLAKTKGLPVKVYYRLSRPWSV